MKAKGEFETAKKLYKRAIIIENDPYSKGELIKLNVITNENMSKCLEDLALELAKKKSLISKV